MKFFYVIFFAFFLTSKTLASEGAVSVVVKPSKSYASYYNEAINLFKAKNYEAVLSIYSNCGSMCQTDPFFFLSRLSYRNLGNVSKSIEMLAKTKDSKPAMDYKRAASYYFAGEYELAKDLLKKVLASNQKNLNPAVREQSQTIFNISKKLTKPISASVGYGIGRDSNVNYSPSASSVRIFGFDIQLDKPQKDDFQFFSGDLSYKKRIGKSKFGIIGSNNISLYKYDTITTRNMLQYNAINGIYYGTNKK